MGDAPQMPFRSAERTVERVTYQNAENGFFVVRVKARSHRDLVTLVGRAAAISAGEWITALGDWVNGRELGSSARAASVAVPVSSRKRHKNFEGLMPTFPAVSPTVILRQEGERRERDSPLAAGPD